MGKIIDSFALKGILFLFFLVWLDYFTGNFWCALFISAVIVFVLWAASKVLVEKRKSEAYPREKFFRTLAVSGNAYTLNLFLKAMGNEKRTKKNFVLDGDTLYYSAFRFTSAGPDDVAAAYRESIGKKIERIVFLCRKTSRETRVFATTLPVKTVFVADVDIYKKLKAAKVLPPAEELTENLPAKKESFEFKRFLSAVLNPQNARYYLFSAIVLALTSFITPYKLYYVIVSSLLMLTAIIAYFSDK